MIEIIWFILCLDPVFIYTAVATVSRLRLKAWAEPFAGMNAVKLHKVTYVGVEYSKKSCYL